MKLIHYTLILFIFISSTANAQNTLKGKVTDKATMQPIEGASLFIPEYKKFAVSNATGDFSITDLRGIVVIQSTRIGYKSFVQTVNISTNTDLNISMEPSATELEEVLITSNSSSLTDKIPFSATGISQSAIRNYAAPSVMGNLSYLPGVDRISIGNGIGKPVIRGLSFNQIMLYGQGTRIENQQWDDHHDLGLSDVGVANVELVRGPAALIYGADALGGALIFTDEKNAAPGSTVGDVNLGLSSNTLGLNTDAGIKSTTKNGVFYGVRIGAQSHTNYIQGEGEEAVKKAGEDKPFAMNSKFQSMSAKANVGVSKKWGVSKLSYSYFNQQIGIIEDESADTAAAGGEERDREMEAPYQDVTSHIISVENTFITGKSKVNLNVAYQVNDRKEFEPLPLKQKEKAIGLLLNTTTYDLKWTSNAEKKVGVTIGSQGTFLKNENNGLEALVPDATVNDVAGYGLVRYDKGKLNLLGGVRFDMRKIEAESYEKEGALETDTFIVHSTGDTIAKPETDFEKEYTPFSFSIGAAYHPTAGLTIKLNGASGFSAPNYAQLGAFGKHEGTYRFERGNIALKVEQNTEADLGFIWENEFITIDLGGYINKIKDYIYIQNSGDTITQITASGTNILPVYDYKQGDATIKGAELGFDVHPKKVKWLDFKASYSLTNGTLDKGGNLPYIPSDKMVAELKLMKSKISALSNTYLTLILSNYGKQKNVAQYELSTDGYTLLDLHVGADFKLGKQKASFDIFCTNLLNTGYYNQLSLVKYIGVREMGRNIGVQLHIPFGK